MSAPDPSLFLCATVEDWYINVLAATLERRLDAAGAGTLTWCPHWWEHPEAIARLEALWRAWEVCRDDDGESPARWFWQHCDPMLAVLMDAKLGPLADCNPTCTASTTTPEGSQSLQRRLGTGEPWPQQQKVKVRFYSAPPDGHPSMSRCA